MIEKKPTGAYAITPYGRLALQLTESLEFITRNKRYLLTRDVWRLPYHSSTASASCPKRR